MQLCAVRDHVAVCIFSNDGLLHASGAQHIHYLNTEMNRNPIAFGIALCALTAAILMLHCPQRNRKRLSAVAFLLCSYSVFALGCRSAFLSYVGGMLVLLLDYICNSGNRRTRFARGVVILLLVVCAAAFALNISAARIVSACFIWRMIPGAMPSGKAPAP